MAMRRGAGPFIEAAFKGTRIDYYAIRTKPWGEMPEGFDTWSDRLNGILARQRGRHDHDADRPEKVAAMAFIVAIHDVDDLLTLLMAALFEEQAQKVLDAEQREIDYGHSLYGGDWHTHPKSAMHHSHAHGAPHSHEGVALLKAQLAEKEAEIERLTRNADAVITDAGIKIAEKDAAIERLTRKEQELFTEVTQMAAVVEAARKAKHAIEIVAQEVEAERAGRDGLIGTLQGIAEHLGSRLAALEPKT